MPISRNGKDKSQTTGKRSSASSATGQESTNRTHHPTKRIRVFIFLSFHFDVERQLPPPIPFAPTHSASIHSCWTRVVRATSRRCAALKLPVTSKNKLEHTGEFFADTGEVGSGFKTVRMPGEKNFAAQFRK